MEGNVKIQRFKKEKQSSPQIVGKVFIALLAHYVKWVSLHHGPAWQKCLLSARKLLTVVWRMTLKKTCLVLLYWVAETFLWWSRPSCTWFRGRAAAGHHESGRGDVYWRCSQILKKTWKKFSGEALKAWSFLFLLCLLAGKRQGSGMHLLAKKML